MEKIEVFPSLTLYKNFVNPKNEQKLYDYINRQEWDTKTLKRYIQQYGYNYTYNTKISKKGKLNKLPTLDILDKLSLLLYNEKYMSILPNQQIINKYIPGEGINAHSDSLIFGKSIATLSLGSDIIMIFTNGDKKIEVLLPKGSLLVLEDDATRNMK